MRIPEIIVQRLDVNAKLPAKPKSLFDAGWDVYPLNRSVIPKHGDALIGTGLKVKIPNGYCIQVNPRSGKAVKNKLVVGARVIDAPYRGELKIHIFNHSDEDYEVSPHDPIAQLLILPCAGIMHEGVIDDITERGEDGFGSTDGNLKYASMHGTALTPEKAVVLPEKISVYAADFKVIEETLAAIASDSDKARGLDKNQALALLEMMGHLTQLVKYQLLISRIMVQV